MTCYVAYLTQVRLSLFLTLLGSHGPLSEAIEGGGALLTYILHIFLYVRQPGGI